MSPSRSVCRSLLRAIITHLPEGPGRARLRTHVVEEFRRNAGQTDPVEIARLTEKAQNYTFLLNAVHHHKDTLISYNISLNREGDQRRKVQQTAQKVGFVLPREPEPLPSSYAAQ
mmetsp:Transcript_23253/g.64557  ORF Transcript_23253/g.64557 Transcript_23253/m.64557 type:complete len:115 (-) Transcript_23253:82-426(-)